MKASVRCSGRNYGRDTYWMIQETPGVVMPFFKELRRRKTGLKLDKSQDSSTDSNSNGSNGTVPPSKSSSTLNSVYVSSTTTPPSSIQPHQSTPNLVKSQPATTMTSMPQRPMPLSGVSNRSSYIVRLSAPQLGPLIDTTAEAEKWC